MTALARHLRDLHAELDDTTTVLLAHYRDCGCRGTGCTESDTLAVKVRAADAQLSLTRFLNDDA